MKSSLTYLKKLELFKELDNHKDGQFFAIADAALKNHLPQWIQFSPHVLWLKNPEQEKTLETFSKAVEFFLKQGIHRNSKLYAFGGGATTDLTGFVAATILRGIPWIAVPTTLLAMIDGSIGGKVAVNMPQGKNLLGSFHAPETIFICGDFLNTLPDVEWISGKGEILKYGFLSREIHDLIIKKVAIEEIAHVCAKFKLQVVERDFREKGERVLLNLGHTLGHAFEASLKIPHGQAVALGLKYIFKIFHLNEALSGWEKMADALELPKELYEISHYQHFDVKKFLSYLEQDKKKVDSMLRLILVKSIGSCYVEEISLKEFKTKIQSNDEFNN